MHVARTWCRMVVTARTGPCGSHLVQDGCDGAHGSMLQDELRKVREDAQHPQLDHVLGFECVLWQLECMRREALQVWRVKLIPLNFLSHAHCCSPPMSCS